MSEAKHTPGPWVIERPINHVGMVEIDGPSLTCRGFTIATDVDAQRAACIEADARLIAAAPDLLEALEWALDAWDTHNRTGDPMQGDWESYAIAAIAKAKGEQP